VNQKDEDMDRVVRFRDQNLREIELKKKSIIFF